MTMKLVEARERWGLTSVAGSLALAQCCHEGLGWLCCQNVMTADGLTVLFRRYVTAPAHREQERLVTAMWL